MDWTCLKRLPRVYEGSIDRDMLGVGLFSRGGQQADTVVYTGLAAGRDDKHPTAPLSQAPDDRAYADSALRNAAALLGVPALGGLEI